MESELQVQEKQETVKAENTEQQSVDVVRAVKEVEGAIISAKKFPRDIEQSYSNIIKTCRRKKIAENAMYSYPRGGKLVTGASIRLAEVLAQNYGNMQFGIRELSNKNGESEVEAYCWDLETNTRMSKNFRVKHVRDTKFGKKDLKDERDVYEIVANMGARRVRACILSIIPADIVEDAIRECEKTVSNANDEPIDDRRRKMVSAYDSLGVTKKMLEERLGHKIREVNSDEIVELTKIYKTIKDGVAKRSDYFQFQKETTSKNADKLNQEFAQDKKVGDR
jgi:hypothetical protein